MASLADFADGERTARVVLSMVAEPADANVGRLLRREGGMETLRLLDADGPMPGIRAEEAAILQHRTRVVSSGVDFDAVLRRALDGAHEPLMPGDAHWPASVDGLGDRAPYVLWAKGATSFLAVSAVDRVTITGSRASTSYGDHVAAELAHDAAMDEQIVVSGGAYGIDGAAHRAVLTDAGHTIAVLASGPDRLYPAGHRDLLEQVADRGLVVSELPPGSAPTRHRFIARGRLLAAMSSATVIVEAGARSGALNVAREAQALGRSVGAVPGPVTSAASTGPLLLLQEGTAALVSNSRDVTALMNEHPSTPVRDRGMQSGHTLDGPELDQDQPGRSL
ncbi:DNA-processing protein DprA [Brevibacterium ammoniilyticum]|uniref:DNA-processing protein DprA n=1 Tax=Brevibacterium ammoniilyticum TaxID=1046555 RepID=A0ABP9U8X7_9MICO